MHFFESLGGVQRGPRDTLDVLGFAVAQLQLAEVVDLGNGQVRGAGKGVPLPSGDGGAHSIMLNQQVADDPRHGGGDLLAHDRLHQGFVHGGGPRVVVSVKIAHHVVQYRVP